MFFCQVKSLEAEVKKVKEHEEFYQNKVGIMTYVIVTWDTCKSYWATGAHILISNKWSKWF